MTTTIGTKAFHKGDPGEIVWIYDNGNCEFKNYITRKITLVFIDELSINEDDSVSCY